MILNVFQIAANEVRSIHNEARLASSEDSIRLWPKI